MNQPVFDKEILYRAIQMTDAPGVDWLENLYIFDSTDSTNSKAKEMAEEGYPHGTVIIANRQYMGRGRMGRSFHSPSGLGLYMSVILRPDCHASQLMHLTCAVAVAVINGLRRELHTPMGQGPMIKWTNDIILPPWKLGGILTELSLDASGKVRYAIVGIGLNLYHRRSDFPPELQDTAVSLGMCFRDCPPKHHLINSILYELHRIDQHLDDKGSIMARYQDYCYTLGKQISIHQGDTVRHGTALSVNTDGALVVRYDDGGVGIVNSGEVSIRGMYGYV